jgi:hypothetical protein
MVCWSSTGFGFLPSSLYWQHRRFRFLSEDIGFCSSLGFGSVVFCYHRFLRHKQEIGFCGSSAG